MQPECGTRAFLGRPPKLLECSGAFPIIYTEGKTAHAAVARKMAKELIDSGLPNVDTARAKDLSTPAHFATRMAASELLASLIARRANFGLRDTSGSTVMHVATRMACPENATGLAIMKQLVVGGCMGPCDFHSGLA